ncbi:hypothetical protein BaRGS_00026546, partial [Batillaria attramentaria]
MPRKNWEFCWLDSRSICVDTSCAAGSIEPTPVFARDLPALTLWPLGQIGLLATPQCQPLASEEIEKLHLPCHYKTPQ